MKIKFQTQFNSHAFKNHLYNVKQEKKIEKNYNNLFIFPFKN
jgi:hypothetical protein